MKVEQIDIGGMTIDVFLFDFFPPDVIYFVQPVKNTAFVDAEGRERRFLEFNPRQYGKIENVGNSR